MLSTIDSFDLADKTLLLRYDLNVSFHQGMIVDDSRLQEAATSIRTLLTKHPKKLVIMAHLGRPKGQHQAESSLQKVQKPLIEILKRPIHFISNPFDNTTNKEIQNLPSGSIVLLENMRFWSAEENNDPQFAQSLAALGDVFINDAFSVSHRAHASSHGVAQYLPACAGPLLQAEITTLDRCLQSPVRPNIAVVGGAKISTKIGIIEHLIPNLDHLIIGGAMANTFLHAAGKAVGKSLCERDAKPLVDRIMQQAKNHHCAVHLPVDVAVACGLDNGQNAENVSVDDVPDHLSIFDVGPQSAAQFCRVIDQCATVLWNGPLGAFEYPPFDHGTQTVAQHVAQRTQQQQCLSVAGGGDTLAALKHAEANTGFSHVSTAGGAFLEWLQGDDLPCIEVLHNKS